MTTATSGGVLNLQRERDKVNPLDIHRDVDATPLAVVDDTKELLPTVRCPTTISSVSRRVLNYLDGDPDVDDERSDLRMAEAEYI